jgi:hypothetical protein
MVLSRLKFTVSDCLFGIFRFLFDSCSCRSHVCYHITYISTVVRLCVMYVQYIYILILLTVSEMKLILQYWQSYHIFCIDKIEKFALKTFIVAIFKFMWKKRHKQEFKFDQRGVIMLFFKLHCKVNNIFHYQEGMQYDSRSLKWYIF